VENCVANLRAEIKVLHPKNRGFFSRKAQPVVKIRFNVLDREPRSALEGKNTIKTTEKMMYSLDVIHYSYIVFIGVHAFATLKIVNFFIKEKVYRLSAPIACPVPIAIGMFGKLRQGCAEDYKEKSLGPFGV
jgi:hypothetical protein